MFSGALSQPLSYCLATEQLLHVLCIAISWRCEGSVHQPHTQNQPYFVNMLSGWSILNLITFPTLYIQTCLELMYSMDLGNRDSLLTVMDVATTHLDNNHYHYSSK